MFFLQGVSVVQFGKELYREINDDNIFNGAAALAYYLTLAIFPAMIFVMALIPYLPVPHLDQAIMDLLRQAMPADAASMFADVVKQVTGEQRGGLLSFGIIATLWVMSSGMYAVMQQLDITYDVKDARNFFKARALALALSVLFALLMLGGFSLIVLGGVIQQWIATHFGSSIALLLFFAVLRWVIVVAGVLLGFALVYYLGPDVKQEFKYITPGSALGCALLVAASLGFSWYVQNFGNYDATYGSIGAVIVLMLWLYITGLVILLGSEINALVEHHAGQGKLKGERYEGQRRDDPTVRERVQRAAPERTRDERLRHDTA